jgi:hypothetical protein
MIIQSKLLAVATAIIVLGLYGIGFTESEIPLILKYEFPVFNKQIYSSHSATFAHSTHAMEYKITCVRCHHTLEPGAIAVEESCLDCHGRKAIRNQRDQRIPREKRAQPYLIALHRMCIECHKEVKANNSYSTVSVACWRCHIRKKKSKFN